MFTQKELTWIIVAIIIFEFIIIFPSYKNLTIPALIAPILIVFTSVITKKVASSRYNLTIEHKSWEFQNYGWSKESRFKKPFPIGLVFPILITILFNGIIKPLIFLQFDSKDIFEKRILKKRGLKRKTEINDSDIAFTACWGFYALIILAVIGSLFKLPELTAFSIFYGAWNLIPFGNLDGSKVFFGSVINWAILVVFYAVSLVIVLL